MTKDIQDNSENVVKNTTPTGAEVAGDNVVKNTTDAVVAETSPVIASEAKQSSQEGEKGQDSLDRHADKSARDDASVEKPAKKRTKKVKRSVPSGQLHIQATFNNTIISFTDSKGGVLAACSAGACGFRGSKKGTAYAAQIAVDKAADVDKNTYGLRKIAVFVKGVGLGRDAAIRATLNHGMIIDSITDVTGIPHGGVRPKKARRV
jgi:small subunit ribosomal protein S11